VRFLDVFERMIRGEIDQPPVARLIGFRIVEAEAGRVRFELPIEERHTSPPGSAHGGVLVDVADAAMGCAYGTLLAEGDTWTTVELKVNYVRPAWPGQTVYAEGRVVNAGRTLALTECDVRNGDGKLLARASSTCMRLASAESPAASAGS